ncbi:MAG: hypothetical protein HC802_20365 [Caldilineaceae bacterium]|nr:hypothetical protein [Caldilineaceae bacterium]
MREYVQILSRWLWLLILGAGVAMVAALFAYQTFSPWPQYEATVTVMVGNDNLPTPLAPDALQMLRATYVQLASRRPVTQQVVEALNLHMSAEDLSERLRVGQVANTRLIDISAVADDPVMAAAIANEVAVQLSSAPANDQSDAIAQPSQIQVLAPALRRAANGWRPTWAS